MTASDTAMRVIVAGGGTGGHLFPGIAMAEAFLARDPRTEILFVGTDRPFEREILARAGFPHRRITAEGIKGRGLKALFRSALKIPLGILQATWILVSFRPAIVIGVGGYASGPMAAAAWLTGIPVVLQEQNLLPGITNRIVGRIARRTYVSFPETRGFDPARMLVTGNPVRREILDAGTTPKGEGFSVLILGGSQGAHGINAAVAAALPHLKAAGIRFCHQTGEADLAMMRDAYASAGIDAEVLPFIQDMGKAYGEADLVLCRAGATTVAELTALGKPALFVPFPHAADNHQVKNAEVLTRAGAAEMILEKELTPESLSELLLRFQRHPEILREMTDRARTLGRPEAAETIVDDCCRLAGLTPSKEEAHVS